MGELQTKLACFVRVKIMNVAEENPKTNTENSDTTDKPNVSHFECKICMDVAKSPVVTQCGHLYCWECILRWSEHKKSESIECPVCNYVLNVNKLIP